MGLNWLITGGCGFIGTNIVQRLVREEGHTIRIIDNLSVGTKESLNKVAPFVVLTQSDLQPMASKQGLIELIIADIQDKQLASVASKGADVILHLAANTGVGPSVENPRFDCVTNVLGILNYLEAARECNISRFVFASSGAPVGEVVPPIHEELAPHPVSPYGASKLAGEGYCSAYKHTFGVDTVALRFGNVYGPGSSHKASIVAKFINIALQGDLFEIYGDGQQTRDFIFIDDLVDAVLLAAIVPDVGGEIFQIATNRETSISEIVTELTNQLKKNEVKNINIKYGKKRQGDVMRNYSDTSKALKMLGWFPKTDLKTGLGETINYFLNSSEIQNFK